MEYKLFEEILKISEANIWDNAKSEWEFDFVYKSGSPKKCLCGHYPIKNICVLKNVKNNKQTEVGNCCVSKFLHIDIGTKILAATERVKVDINKSIGSSILEYLKEKKFLSKYECNFYSDTLKKRKLTEKQLEFRVKINRKVLIFICGEDISVPYRINKILNWVKFNEWFDCKFVLSLERNYVEKGELTTKQNKALDGLIKKFHI